MSEKTLSIKNLILIVIAVILMILFIVIQSIPFRLTAGGLFLLIFGLYDYIVNVNNRFSATFQMIAGIMALLALLAPKSVNLFLFLFYMAVILMLIGFLYFHRKVGNNFKKSKAGEIVYRIAYLILFTFIGWIVITTIRSVMSYGFNRPLPLSDYLFTVQLVFIAIISSFLFVDNFLRLVIPEKFMQVLFGQKHNSRLSLFASLALTLLVGGFYYINNSENAVLNQILVVLGAIFITSLLISDSLKSLFSKS